MMSAVSFCAGIAIVYFFAWTIAYHVSYNSFLYSVKINDDSRLSECNISNGDTLNLVILTPFDVYVQGLNGKNRTVYVDSEVSGGANQ